jgi:hypothetical protein
MLPEIEEPRYRELRDVARVNEISDWLIHGASRDGAKSECADRMVIEELDTVVSIHRAILKFEAVVWKDKTPQMTSFRKSGPLWLGDRTTAAQRAATCFHGRTDSSELP